MSTPRKTQRGEAFNNTYELLEWLERGYWIYFRHKPTHPSWALGWQLWTIKRAIQGGYLYECLDLASNPYFSPSLTDLSCGLELTNHELQMLRDADHERKLVARNFLSNKRGAQWVI